MDDNYPPFVFKNDAGELQGIVIDQWRLWEHKTGVKAEIRGMDWSHALEAMRAGDFDVIDTVFDTDERGAYLDFTKPYARLEVPIFFRQGISGITDLASLKGFPVAAKSGDTAADLLQQRGIAPVLLFNNYEAIAEAAAQGRVSVFVMDKPPALYFLNKLGIAGEFKLSDPVLVGDFHRAVRKGNTGLLQQVEQGFLALDESELRRIDDKWHGYMIVPASHRRELGYVLLIGLAALALLFGWNWTLARQVRKRTLALQLAESQLRVSEDRLRSVLDGLFAFVGLLSNDGTLLECNRAPLTATGKRKEDVVGRPFADGDWFAPQSREQVLASVRRAAEGEVVREGIQVRVAGGHALDFDVSFNPLRDPAGRVSQIVVSGVDVTQRTLAEGRIRQLNRVYAVLSEINEAIVRERDPQAVLEAACRIAVDKGRFRMAWIGMLGAGSTAVRPVAAAGVVDGYLELLDLDLANDAHRVGPTARALLTNAHAICADIASDPSFLPWREEALRRAYRASAAFPLCLQGKPVGAFNLYADAPGFFDTEELRLLDELATDISFALEVDRREREREAADDRHTRQRNELIALTGQRSFDGSDVPAVLQLITEAAARTLAVARVSIWRYHADHSTIECVELFEATAQEHSAGAVLSAASHPGYFRAMAEIEVIAADDAVSDARTREFADDYLRPLGIGSMLDVPIHVGGRPDGVLCHEHVGPPRHWTADEKTFAVAMGNLVTLALEGAERRRAEAARQESEERLRQLAENIQEAFWMTDPAKQRVLYVSPGYEKIWGRTCASLYAAPGAWLDAIHPDDRARVAQAAATQQPRGGYDETYRILRPDGTERWIRDRAFPVRSAEGQVLQIVGSAQDITDLKHAEEALRASEARYRSLFESAPDGIFVTDSGGAYLDVNPAGQRMLGYAREELLAMTSADVVADPGGLGSALGAIKAGQRYQQEWRFRRKDGTVFNADVLGTIMTDGRLLGLVRDVTDRQRAEEDRKTLEAQLRQSQKMEAIGRLAGGVAHDFNNMLGVILGHADMALRKLRPVDPLFKRLEAIRDAGHRSAGLTRQLLAFSRQQPIAPRILDLKAQVGGMEELLHRLIGEDVELRVVGDPALGLVSLDPSQVDQIVANLAVNARDAMPDGGQLTFETADVTADERYCARHPGAHKGDYVMLAVRDTGCGMDERTRERAFEPFFTTKADGKGTGLGLATIYGIVKQNDGFVEIESEVGRGTTIKLFFPRASSAREAVPARAEPLRSAEGRETILLVEDEEQLREIARTLLEESGYSVLDVSNGGEAIALCEKHTGEIHLLLTDVVMPRMNGKELADRIRAMKPGIRTLFASGYTADTIGRRGVLDPGVHFIEKPFTLEALARKVREALS